MRRAMTRVVPALASAAVAVLVSACGAGAGHGQHNVPGRAGEHGGGNDQGRALVTGTFVRVGGPLGPDGQQPPELRLRGTVQFRSASGHLVTVRVGRTGHFTVYLRPGTYAVTGRSPQILQVSSTGGTGIETRCSLPLHVTIRAWHPAKVTVTCAVP
jgi:hypothetical protein